jgi:hypothetical protein
MQRHFDGMPREIKSISENYGHDMTFNLSPSSQISIIGKIQRNSILDH